MKKIIIGIVVLAVLGLGYFLLTGNKPSYESNQIAPEPQAASSPTESPKSASHSMNIQGFAFSQPSLTAKKGDMMTWINKDSAPHTVTWDNGGLASSGTLKQGESFSFTFNAVGTFSYRCAFHPSMKGKIIVE